MIARDSHCRLVVKRQRAFRLSSTIMHRLIRALDLKVSGSRLGVCRRGSSCAPGSNDYTEMAVLSSIRGRKRSTENVTNQSVTPLISPVRTGLAPHAYFFLNLVSIDWLPLRSQFTDNIHILGIKLEQAAGEYN